MMRAQSRLVAIGVLKCLSKTTNNSISYRRVHVKKEAFDLVAEIREGQGKGASRRLRHEGKVPAIIYGAGRPPRALSFDQNKVLRQLENESFYSSILNIQVNDKSQAAIVKDIQRHPAKMLIMHMDFQRVVEDEKIKMNVPIHYLNAETAEGVKEEGGAISQLISDVEISCFPRDLPEYFEVDIEHLKLNEMMHLSDIKLPEGVEIPQLAQGPEHDHAMISIQFIKEVVEEEVEEAVEVPVAGEDGADDATDDAGGDTPEG
jgi:large subunit ribosomal protein L25